MQKQLLSTNSNERETPQWLFTYLDKTFRFNLDPCATAENAKCARFFTKEQDGLKQSWKDANVFCNSPYGKELPKWVKKCSESDAFICVCLIPARTDTKYWHEYIAKKATTIWFLKGRLKFGNQKNSAPFPSAIVIFSRGLYFSDEQTISFLDLRGNNGELKTSQS